VRVSKRTRAAHCKGHHFLECELLRAEEQEIEVRQTPEIRELRQLREENAKLKQIVADLSLDRKMLQEIISKKL
jgi:hypothetical protein